MQNIKIGKKIVGKNKPTFIVAEPSGNHKGKLKNMLELISIAKQSGADAVKIQLYTPDSITINSNKKDFLINRKNTWSKYKTLYDLYVEAHTPFDWLDKIFEHAKKIDIQIFSSVFDFESLRLLEKKNCLAYKIASNEITDLPLIEKVAKTKKPVMISTGLASKKDISEVVKIFNKVRNKKLIILKCTSNYPTPYDEVNLNVLKDISKKFNVLTGISDHSLGIRVPIVATALDVCVIEKHLIKSKKTNTVDSFFSLDKNEFKKMVNEIRLTEKIIGNIDYKLSKETKLNFKGRRSLYVTKVIKKGEKITSDNIKSVRPGLSLHPKYYYKILGKKVKKNLYKGDRLKLDLIY